MPARRKSKSRSKSPRRVRRSSGKARTSVTRRRSPKRTYKGVDAREYGMTEENPPRFRSTISEAHGNPGGLLAVASGIEAIGGGRGSRGDRLDEIISLMENSQWESVSLKFTDFVQHVLKGKREPETDTFNSFVVPLVCPHIFLVFHRGKPCPLDASLRVGRRVDPAVANGVFIRAERVKKGSARCGHDLPGIIEDIVAKQIPSWMRLFCCLTIQL